jgi:hypothetical protein
MSLSTQIVVAKKQPLTLFPKKYLTKKSRNLQNEVDWLKNLLRIQNDGNCVLDIINRHINFFISSTVSKNESIKTTKNRLKNISFLFNLSEPNELINDELQKERTELAIQNLHGFSKANDKIISKTFNINEVMKIFDNKISLSYADILNDILTYNDQLMEKYKEIYAFVNKKFLKKPKKYFDINQNMGKIISDLQNINQTVNDYLNKITSINDLYINNFLRIADSVKSNGFSHSHTNKVNNLLCKMDSYLKYDNAFLKDRVTPKTIRNKMAEVEIIEVIEVIETTGGAGKGEIPTETMEISQFYDERQSDSLMI